MNFTKQLMSDFHSHRIPYPHHIDHGEKIIYIKVRNWMSALGASKLVEKWYPGFQCNLVSEEAMARIEKEAREKE